MSNSSQPHGLQPTRLLHPWDFPGKSPGVGCHCLLQCRKVKSEREVAQSCLTLRDPMDCSPPGSSVHGTFQARLLGWGAIAFSEKQLYPSPQKKPISEYSHILRYWVLILQHMNSRGAQFSPERLPPQCVSLSTILLLPISVNGITIYAVVSDNSSWFSHFLFMTSYSSAMFHQPNLQIIA